MIRKQFVLPILFIGLFVLPMAISPATATYGLTTRRDTVRANIQFTVTATGLTAGTVYTLYVDGSLYRNKTASSTSMDFDVVLTSDYVDQSVTIELKDSAGSTTHATLTVYVEDVIPQHIINMIGGLLPYIAGFSLIGVFLGVIGGLAYIVKRMF